MDNAEKRRSDYLRVMGGETRVKALTAKTVGTKPLANENTSPLLFVPGLHDPNSTPQTSNSPVDYKTLWAIWSSSPECIAPCDTIVTDIIADGYTIRPVNAKNKTAVKTATEFLEATQFKTRVLPSQLYDQLVTGDGYVQKSKISEEQVRDSVKAIARRLPLVNKGKMQEYIYYSMRQTDLFRTRKLINIASSTIRIKHDTFGNIIKYLQQVGTNKSEFSAAEVMHFKYMNLNGKVYSFCPMKAIISELEVIALIKDNAGNVFDNGGQPSYIFNLEDETPKSDNTTALQQQLIEFKENINKHRNLIATGKLKIDKLENMAADMQYRELLEQMTRIVYTVWGVPPSKMGQSGSGSSGAYDSGLATEGYYRRIAHMQDMIYSQYNSEIFVPEFGVELIPRKAYLQDELKETQMTKQKFDIAQQAWTNNWINEEWIKDYLEIEERYWGTFEKNEPLASTYKQGDLKKGVVEGNTPKQEINKMKQDTQKAKTPNAKLKALTKREIEAIEFNEQL